MVARFVVVVVGCLALLVMIEIAGPVLVGVSEVVPVTPTSDVSHVAPQVANAIAAVDHVVSMLFATAVGLFAVAGLLLRDAPTRGLSAAQLVGPGLFFVLSAVGIYLGFVARMQALHNANFLLVPMQDVQQLIGWQGTAVAFSAVALLVIFYDTLFAAHRGEVLAHDAN
jgi:hypothetical protein